MGHMTPMIWIDMKVINHVIYGLICDEGYGVIYYDMHMIYSRYVVTISGLAP